MSASSGDIQAGRAFVRISISDDMTAGLASASKKLRSFGQGMRDVAQGLLTSGTAMATPFVFAGRTFASFEDQMATLRAVADNTGEGFVKLTEQAKMLGRTTSFSATQVAQAMTELARAGFTTEQISKSIAATLDVARVGAIELGHAATVVSDLIRAFGLTADSAQHVGDVLVKTANVSSTSIPMIAESMQYLGVSAATTKHSIEEMSAALAVMANRGLKGEMAGASLALAMSQLSQTTVADALRNINVEIKNTNHGMISLVDLLSQLNNATKDKSSIDKLALFSKLFDERGKRSMLILSRNVAELERLRGALRETNGDMRRAAKIMDDTLGGSFRKLMRATESVQIALGEVTKTTMREWMQSVQNASAVIANMIENHGAFIVSVMKGIAAILASGAAMYAMGAAISFVGTVAGGISSAISSLSVGMVGLFASIRNVNKVWISLGDAIGNVKWLAEFNAIQKLGYGMKGTAEFAREMRVQMIEAIKAVSFQTVKNAFSGVVASISAVITAIRALTVASALAAAKSAILAASNGVLSISFAVLRAAIIPIGSAVAVAFAGYEIGRWIGKITGATKAAEKFFSIIYSAREMSQEEVDSVIIKGWEDQLNRGAISADEFRKRLANLRKEQQKGDARFLPKQDTSSVPETVQKTQDAITAEKKYARDLEDYKLSLRADSLQKDIAIIETKYQREFEEAEKTGADIASLQEKRTLEIAETQRRATEKNAELERDSLKRFRDLQISLIEDDDARTRAGIMARYDDEVEAAQGAIETIARLEEMRELELRAAERADSKRRAEDLKAADDAAQSVNIDRQWRIAEMMLEANYQGVELEKAKLELARQRALIEAKAAGASLNLVEREYALRGQLLSIQSAVEKFDVAGTFSSAAASAIAQGTSNDALRTAKATEQSAEYLKRIERKVGPQAIVR